MARSSFWCFSSHPMFHVAAVSDTTYIDWRYKLTVSKIKNQHCRRTRWTWPKIILILTRREKNWSDPVWYGLPTLKSLIGECSSDKILSLTVADWSRLWDCKSSLSTYSIDLERKLLSYEKDWSDDSYLIGVGWHRNRRLSSESLIASFRCQSFVLERDEIENHHHRPIRSHEIKTYVIRWKEKWFHVDNGFALVLLTSISVFELDLTQMELAVAFDLQLDIVVFSEEIVHWTTLYEKMMDISML